MDFEKIDFRECMLYIQKDDGMDCIQEEIANESEKAIITEFKETFPKGKENYKIIDGVVVELTEEEKEALRPTPVTQPTEVQLLQGEIANVNYILMMNGLL